MEAICLCSSTPVVLPDCGSGNDGGELLVVLVVGATRDASVKVQGCEGGGEFMPQGALSSFSRKMAGPLLNGRERWFYSGMLGWAGGGVHGSEV